MRFTPLAVGAVMLAVPARAEVPNVVTDILPVQALVSQVMQGVGEPIQLLPATQSPHSYAMRPSEARALQNADVVFWIGKELSPAMDEAIDSLVSDGETVSLLHLNGTRELEFRESETFLKLALVENGDAHDDHDDHADHEGHEEHGNHDEHGHDDHEAHDEHEAHDAHAEEIGHDDHDGHGEENHDDHAHEGHDDHDHDGVDPHAWLDPKNAQFWLSAIADRLAAVDPDNAAAYRANAQSGQVDIDQLMADVTTQLAPFETTGFVVFHDAYQYFETRFGLTASGAILAGDAEAPSAARLSNVRETLHAHDISCVFTEPQYNDKVVRAISDGLLLHSEELDPLGAALTSPDYTQLIRNVADRFEACLSSS
ncbi:zinc ABC transporter substrate-binding protein [Shimia sp.]|uniref:zinc ABC transporter substrate-binding protein n=1 Tax=Shimia sp. TaxID=1954381 RepID=UPI003B8B00A7